ncbi:cyclic nucleotide-binding domain-containing protein [Synechococcus sp. MU1643]|uniref:cyclic nucleotide-binding domain-containing protein n=1 Tax=Synechococcus sp. MU1643 TaxID=2508349 RepID=UPI001CF8B250|nr:cyclic nucleotide-binding domain-containing protein [Synechococcus sp. MU1643]MCB4428458.1 cyclic nucleotide-binding domain-containing protein [Synechococcus sp. MU1643]
MYALDTMRALSSKAEVIHLKPGEVLFRTGETGACMYGLLEGSVRLTWIDSAGYEGHEDILLGHVFGAGALVVEDNQRLSTATATSECRLIAMNRDKFLFAIQETPMFAVQLLASIDTRLCDIKLAEG